MFWTNIKLGNLVIYVFDTIEANRNKLGFIENQCRLTRPASSEDGVRFAAEVADATVASWTGCWRKIIFVAHTKRF